MKRKIGLYAVIGFLLLLAIGAIGKGVAEITNGHIVASPAEVKEVEPEKEEVKSDTEEKEVEKKNVAEPKKEEKQEKQEKQERQEKEVEKKAEEPNKEEKEEKVEQKNVEQKKVAAQPKEKPKDKFTSAQKAEIVEYQKAIMSYTDNMGKHLNKLGEQNLKASEDISLIFDQNWIITTAGTIAGMQISIEEFKQIGVPEHFKESNALIETANEHFTFVVENYPTAVDNMDADLITESAGHMRTGGEFINTATVKLEEEIAILKRKGYKQ